MSNLYEILEVSEKASKEVIEKAYRVLAKKYHPDLQMPEEKQKAENIMKQINEAYEILSDDEKRKEYDISLMLERKKKEIEIERKINNRNRQENDRKIEYNNINYEEKQTIINEQEQYQDSQNLQNEMNRAYAQAYNNYLRSLRLQIKRTLDVETFYKFN